LQKITSAFGGKMKIYMDDVRETPDGFTRTYTVEETKTALLSRQVTFLSLDNDMGSDDPKTEGFNVINYIEELVNDDPTFPIPEIVVHSSNSARAILMRLGIKKLEMLRNKQILNEV
jgi:hypothetical protein